jgi:glycerophosphoryl diester phosphodiesterase
MIDFLDGFTVAAHRGASREFPENTVESFRRALEIMPQCLLELDVRMTAGGEAAVFHDALLEPKTDGSGPVRAFTLSQLKKLDAGYGISFDQGASYPFRGKGFRIASLDEILKGFPAARMSIDIKDNDLEAAARAISIISENGSAGRVIVASFHSRVIRFVRKSHPGIATGFSKRDILYFFLLHKIGLARFYTNGGTAMFVPEFAGTDVSEYQEGVSFQGVRVVTKRFIRNAHKRGIPVLIWTIDGIENMRRLVSWGADGIVTDYPDLLKRVIEERKS